MSSTASTYDSRARHAHSRPIVDGRVAVLAQLTMGADFACVSRRLVRYWTRRSSVMVHPMGGGAGRAVGVALASDLAVPPGRDARRRCPPGQRQPRRLPGVTTLTAAAA